ncbi:MAG: signal peptidase II [Rhizobiales bacterium NRL2]|nr:MAG: signal peptidase II [Rhizobiales bacterium NRL2]
MMIVSVIVVDQASKYAAIVLIASRAVEIQVTSFFSFVLSFNTGVSFGLLTDVLGNQQIVLASVLLAVTLGIGVFAFRRNSFFPFQGAALIVGGSLGNIIDRFRQGAVTDFILLYYESWAWPVFNLADSAIFFGCVLIIFHRSDKVKAD